MLLVLGDFRPVKPIKFFGCFGCVVNLATVTQGRLQLNFVSVTRRVVVFDLGYRFLGKDRVVAHQMLILGIDLLPCM